MKEVEFLGLPCITLASGDISLLLTTSVGPRVLALQVGEVGNLFAELPDIELPNPSGGVFRFHGGHRLWYAPEIPEITYLPDDRPVAVETVPGGVRLIGVPEPGSGIQKEMSVRFEDDGAIQVDHGISNSGTAAVTCAPWAITQLMTGGTAILPQPGRMPGTTAVQPNRSLVLWPYTDLDDDCLQLGNEYVLVSAKKKTGAIKVGSPNPDGWLGYAIKGVLFVKFASFDASARYFDLGASSQCYCNPDFIEMETLGPEVVLQPGESAFHRETWRVFRDIPVVETEQDARQLAATLRLRALADPSGGL